MGKGPANAEWGWRADWPVEFQMIVADEAEKTRLSFW
jgi:hypothetical protein